MENLKRNKINVEELCAKIAAEIDHMNLNDMKMLENLGKMVGTPKDSEILRNKIKKIQDNLNEQLFLITRDIKEINSPTAEKNAKLNLQRERIEEAFKATLVQFNDMQKDIKTKQKTHILVKIDLNKRSSDDHILLDSTEAQQVLLKNIEEEENRMLKRQAEMQNIQTDIVDLHQMFCDLGEMTEKQGETVDTVDKTISQVAEEVEIATKELNVVETQTCMRRKTMMVCSAVIIIIIIIAILIGVISHFCK
ncbi:syntaxin-7-like [Anthonomus grandis grandis]|uniref:syntaxin-7-like n=1 Tax=Anthonomus grandis grandis TaxID=2921223 RepID=UPI002166A95A|nr:syntaxin-7-like [Anthonomus grandis grandis]